MVVFLLHGKDSNIATSNTVQTLIQHLDILHICPINYNSAKYYEGLKEYFDSCIDILMSELYEYETEFAFIGCSLGGFWSNYLANKYKGSKLIMVNPSLKYYGEDKVTVCKDNEVTIFLSKDDKVVPYEFAYELYKGKADIHLFEDGGHRFSHLEEQIPVILKALNNVVD
jgi:predicted esterase YcpF (UPF0227 family)